MNILLTKIQTARKEAYLKQDIFVESQEEETHA